MYSVYVYLQELSKKIQNECTCTTRFSLRYGDGQSIWYLFSGVGLGVISGGSEGDGEDSTSFISESVSPQYSTSSSAARVSAVISSFSLSNATSKSFSLLLEELPKLRISELLNCCQIVQRTIELQNLNWCDSKEGSPQVAPHLGPLSSPEGQKVNDRIQPDLCSLTYVSVDDAARIIVQAGRGALLAKVDIKSAYWLVPVHPEDRLLLGMAWAWNYCAGRSGGRS